MTCRLSTHGNMGIDIAVVRADAESAVAAAMRASLRRRGMQESLLATASEADRDWRAAQRAVEEARANAIRQNREVGRLKRSGDEAAVAAQIQVAHEAGQNETALRPRVDGPHPHRGGLHEHAATVWGHLNMSSPWSRADLALISR